MKLGCSSDRFLPEKDFSGVGLEPFDGLEGESLYGTCSFGVPRTGPFGGIPHEMCAPTSRHG